MSLEETLIYCHPERNRGPRRARCWRAGVVERGILVFRMREHRYFAYIMINCSRHPLYTGVTRSVDQRSAQHKSQFDGPTSYTARYEIDRLVYFEKFQNVRDAIHREKQIKFWGRAKKIALIESVNPKWDDLSGDWQKSFSMEKPRSLAALGMTIAKETP